MKQQIKGRLECVICGKGVQTANLVSFSKRRIKHIRKPNLHTHHMIVDGTRIKVKVCTSCKRLLRESDRSVAKVAAKTVNV